MPFWAPLIPTTHFLLPPSPDYTLFCTPKDATLATPLMYGMYTSIIERGRNEDAKIDFMFFLKKWYKGKNEKRTQSISGLRIPRQSQFPSSISKFLFRTTRGMVVLLVLRPFFFLRFVYMRFYKSVFRPPTLNSTTFLRIYDPFNQDFGTF